MEVIPEAATALGAGVTAFLVTGVKRAIGSGRIFDRVAVLVTVAVGVGVAALLYYGGLVDDGGSNPARIFLAGVVIALAASGARSQLAAVRE